MKVASLSFPPPARPHWRCLQREPIYAASGIIALHCLATADSPFIIISYRHKFGTGLNNAACQLCSAGVRSEEIPHMTRLIRAWITILLLAVPAAAGNWPGWRGPDGDGHSPDKESPLRWTTTENVRWKVSLPDEGNSSPIVWGQRVFLTQAMEKVDWPPTP